MEGKLPSRTEGLGAKGGHKCSRNRSKIDEKRMQKSMRNSENLFNFGSILGSVWDHFGSILDPFWIHLGSILGPFGVLGGVLWRKSFQVESRTAGVNQGPPIFSVFGRKRGPQGVPKSIKNHEKSMQKSMRNSAGFLHGLGSVVGRLWGCFWDPGPLILSVSCRRDAIFQKFVFFMFGLTFL